MAAVSPFVWRRRIAIRDVDGFNVVWYGNYLAFCDEARAELLRAFGLPPGDFAALDIMPVVVDAQARYHAPARFDDEVDIHVRLTAVRGSRLTFAFAIRRAACQTLLCRIQTTLVLLRRNGELVYLMPPPLKILVDAITAAQPEAPA